MKDKFQMFPGDKIRFLTDLLRKQTDLRNQIESRANIAIGFSAAILAFGLNNLISNKVTPAVITIASASVLSILSGLLALKPPQFLSRKVQEQSVFYNTAIANNSRESYLKKVKYICEHEEEVVKQYTLEVYNLTRYSIRFKKWFTNLSIQILVLGLIFGVILTLI